VHVRVYHAWQDVEPGGVDLLPSSTFEVEADGHDSAVGDGDVGSYGFPSWKPHPDDVTASYDQVIGGHAYSALRFCHQLEKAAGDLDRRRNVLLFHRLGGVVTDTFFAAYEEHRGRGYLGQLRRVMPRAAR
jgi:hypothetical protein